jgi:[ribosomal protein S5]-alanine N-acetyltransferase
MHKTKDLPYPWPHELPTLCGKVTTLRRPTLSDAEALVRVLGDELTLQYWAGRLIKTNDDARRTLEKTILAFEQRDFFQWAIVRPAQNELIGLCKLDQLNEKHHSATVGFVLGRQHWGQGLMTDALQTMLRFAFEDLNLRRLEAFTHPQNTRAHSVLERQGFQVEGCARERYIGRSGPQDASILGLLRRQWTGLANPQP